MGKKFDSFGSAIRANESFPAFEVREVISVKKILESNLPLEYFLTGLKGKKVEIELKPTLVINGRFWNVEAEIIKIISKEDKVLEIPIEKVERISVTE